jgi:hypothetical protein
MAKSGQHDYDERPSNEGDAEQRLDEDRFVEVQGAAYLRRLAVMEMEFDRETRMYEYSNGNGVKAYVTKDQLVFDDVEQIWGYFDEHKWFPAKENKISSTICTGSSSKRRRYK